MIESPMRPVAVPALLPAHAFNSKGYGLHAAYQAPRHVVICYQRSILTRLGERFKLFADNDWPLSAHPYRRLARCGIDENLGVIQLDIGSPLTAYVMETLGHFGTCRFSLLTSAGAIGAFPAGQSLFRVDSAQQLPVQAGHPARVIHAPADASKSGRRLASFHPVHAISVSSFFRRHASVVHHESRLPSVVEMEAFQALETAAGVGAHIEVLGYVSDWFDSGQWRRRCDLQSLQDTLVEQCTKFLHQPARRTVQCLTSSSST